MDNPEQPMVTAEQLRAARAILQMDQADLAKVSGVSVETIKRLERQTGKLHAKIETITAIQKAFEAKCLTFIGEPDGPAAGVLLLHPDKLQLLRKALIGEWAHTMDQSLKAQCAIDPKFFEHGEKRLTQALIKLSVRNLPTIVRSVLTHVAVTHADDDHYEALIPACQPVSVSIATLTHADDDHYEALIPVCQPVSVSTNEIATLSMSAPERAVADAHHLTPAMLGLIEDATNLGALGNRAFTRAFVAAIPASERGALTIAEGGLSAEGVVRARNAVLAKAYGAADVLSRITESTDDEIKSISNALLAAAPQWAKLRADIEAGHVRPDVDTTADLMQAVKQTADIRARGQKLQEFLAQEDAFDKLPPQVELWMRMFYDPFRKCTAAAPRIAKRLRLYVEEATIISNDPDEIQCRGLRLLGKLMTTSRPSTS